MKNKINKKIRLDIRLNKKNKINNLEVQWIKKLLS